MDATNPADRPSLPSHVEVDLPEGSVMAAFECQGCGLSFQLPPGAALVSHPAVVSLYHDHGRDLRTEPWTGLPFLRTTAAGVESTDPVRVRVDVPVDDERLSVRLDDDLTVVETERESTRSVRDPGAGGSS
jgi:hypothetical protein